ncbi:hypothetical protein BH10PAT3_BH10PAT3_0840 [soil metagenome]
MSMHEDMPEAEYVADNLVELESSMAWLAAHGHYEDTLHVFRADVFRLLSKHSAISGGEGWAFFEIPQEPDGGSVAILPNKDLVILFESVKLKKSKLPKRVPHIRITSSERIGVDDGEEYVSTDVCVDQEDDAQYIVGSFPVRPSVSYESSVVPLFFVAADGNLVSANFHGYPSMPSLTESNGKLLPFGHYNNLLDKVDALDVARSLLGEVMDIVPRYVKPE